MWQEIIKAILFGILEGVTEWLPISSTGHLILLNDVLCLSMRPAVLELFEVVIQLGAILAVAVLFWQTLNPFTRTKSKAERAAAFALWGKVLVAVLPSVVLGFLLDDFLNVHFYNAPVVAQNALCRGRYSAHSAWRRTISSACHDPRHVALGGDHPWRRVAGTVPSRRRRVFVLSRHSHHGGRR